MIRIVVAEDQLLIQKDLCRKIEKTGKDIEIVGTALNGQEAYEKVISRHPDILITDIRMPIESGLELIHRLKQERCPCRTVILSGYRDFEYAKEAMKLGVDEYLLKPVSIKDLFYVLETLEEKILSEEDSNAKAALNLLLNSKMPCQDALSAFSYYKQFYLVFMNINSFSTFTVQDLLPYENELKELLGGSSISRYLKPEEKMYVCDGTSFNEKLLVFCLTQTTGPRLDILLKQLLRTAESIAGFVTLCVSKPIRQLENIGLEQKLLKIQISSQLIYAESAVLYNRDFLSGFSHIPDRMDDAALNHFKFLIHSQNLDAFSKELKLFLGECEKQHTTQKDLDFYIKKLLHACFDLSSHSQVSHPELEIDEYISNSRNYADLSDSLCLLFRQLFHKTILHDQSTSSNPGTLVMQIQKYMEENYAADINIHEIARHFSITPAYLSRIFKKYTNVRPIAYLTSYRIQQACHYFQHSQLSVREIAELCGYSNQFYFSKAFKSIQNVSPSEYRISHYTPET